MNKTLAELVEALEKAGFTIVYCTSHKRRADMRGKADEKFN